MPLLNLYRRRSNSVAKPEEVSKLEYRIGNPDVGQGVFLTGTEQPIATYQVREPGSARTVRDMMDSGADVWGTLAGEGRTFYASDADQDDKLTGQTSFAETTPTLAIKVPAGTVAIPGLVAMGQSGTVAGGPITVLIEIDNTDRGVTGTAETIFNARTGGFQLPQPQCTALSTVTAAAGYGNRIMGITVAADVEPAEGISNEVIWTPTGPDFLVGPASFLIYTFAASTGPTWLWTLKWAEFPLSRFGF